MRALKTNRLLKPAKDTTFRKVESLLYRYADFEKAIYEKESRLKKLSFMGYRKEVKAW